jgi:Na+/pantothenate symporter
MSGTQGTVVHNARITLFANLLNTMAGSSFTVGVVAPIAAVFFYNPAGLTRATVFAGAAVWFIATVVLHVAAQRVLGGLQG